MLNTILAIIIILLATCAARFNLLTIGGAVAAVVVGLTSLFIGGGIAVGMLFLFFCTSNILGRWRRQKKQQLGFEKGGKRDHWQVIANGGPAVLGLGLGLLSSPVDATHHTAVILFAAGLAEANADTWATEIGSASGAVPRSIMTGLPVQPGQSGGISMPGTAAATLGSLVIAAMAAFSYYHGSIALRVGAEAAVAGVAGAYVDSFLGATLQAQYLDDNGRLSETVGRFGILQRGLSWMKNDAVNFIAGVSSVLIMETILRFL